MCDSTSYDTRRACYSVTTVNLTQEPLTRVLAVGDVTLQTRAHRICVKVTYPCRSNIANTPADAVFANACVQSIHANIVQGSTMMRRHNTLHARHSPIVMLCSCCRPPYVCGSFSRRCCSAEVEVAMAAAETSSRSAAPVSAERRRRRSGYM